MDGIANCKLKIANLKLKESIRTSGDTGFVGLPYRSQKDDASGLKFGLGHSLDIEIWNLGIS